MAFCEENGVYAYRGRKIHLEDGDESQDTAEVNGLDGYVTWTRKADGNKKSGKRS